MSSFTSKHNDYLDPDHHSHCHHEDPEESRFVDSPCRVSLDHLEREVRDALAFMASNASLFAPSFGSFFESLPSGEFVHEDEEAGEWVFFEDDDCETGWNKEAYAIKIQRKFDDGRLVESVEISAVDCDGNWDSLCEYTSETIKTEERFFAADFLVLNPVFSLLQNSLYSIHVARTGKDPLEQTIGRKSPRETHLRNLASDVLDLCLSVYKKAATQTQTKLTH